MIEVDHLSKDYGVLKAVDDVSFNVDQGEILGFLGPNGAGKSTTMKMLTCFITPTSGTARVMGKDIQTDSLEVRKIVGYLPENAPSYKNMTVVEFLDFIASVRGFTKEEKKRRISKIIETTFLENAANRTIDALSKGYQQRVGFAQALIHDPPVLVLDEPTDGLDPNQKQEVRTLIKNMSQEKAIILSTHILEEMEAVCTRAIIIDQGKIVADGSPDSLLQKSRLYNAVSIKLTEQPGDSIVQSFNEMESIKEVSVQKPTGVGDLFKLQLFPKDKADILMDVNELLKTDKIEPVEIYREKGQMDEVFRNLTIGERV